MALVQHHTDRSMKWLKIMEFLPTVIFFSLLKKKKASSALSFFFQAELFFFLLPFCLFNCGCISHSTSTVLLSHTGACFQCSHSRDLPLDLLSISQSASWLLPYLETSIQGGRGGWGKEGGGGKHCWQAHTGHSWQGTARCWEYLSWSHWWIVGDWRHTSRCCIRVYVFY